MKKMILIILLLSYESNAQKVIQVVMQIADSTETYFYIEKDSTGYNLKTMQISGDSLRVINGLIEAINRKDRTLEIMYAAQDILLWIRPDGYITNWEEWRNAVDKYTKLTKETPLKLK